MTRSFALLAGQNWKDTWSSLVQYAKQLDHDKDWVIKVLPLKRDKTTEQRAWFHTLCKMFGDEVGHSQDEIKQICKAECFGVETVTVAGVTVEVVKSSELAKRDEYSQLIETCYRLAAQAGVILPNPDRFRA